MKIKQLCVLILALILAIGSMSVYIDNAVAEGAVGKITVFSQSGSTDEIAELPLGGGSSTMERGGCGIYSMMHIIQWCTNNGNGIKLSMSEGVTLAKEMIRVCF